jgi:streptogramin lyase
MRALLVAVVLLAPSAAAEVREGPLPAGWMGPSDLAFDAAGRLWVTLDGSWAVGRLDTETGQGTKFELATPKHDEFDTMWALRIAADGSAWTGTETHIHHIDATTGNDTAYALPGAAQLPGDIFLASNGRVWFALVDRDVLVELDPATGKMTEHEVPPRSGPLDFHETDGKVFVTMTYANALATFDPATGNVVLGTRDALASPVGITDDEKGGLWIAEMGASGVSRLFPTTGAHERFPTSPSLYYVVSGPSGILVARDGSVWFAEHFADRVARLDVANGTLHEYDLPSAPGTNMQRIVEGPDGGVWFAEISKDIIGRATFGNEPVEADVPGEANVTAGASVTLPILANGPLKVGSPDENLTVEAAPGEVVLKPAASLAPGDYRVLVATTAGKVTAGRYMLVHVAAAPAKASSVEWGPLLALGLAGAALLLRRR